MSLEQALIDATAAITRLTTVLVSASEAGAVSAAPAPEKATRSKKAAEPVSAPVATTPAPVVTAPSADGTATRYFHIPEHNTVYKQLPGMADCMVQGALLVSEAEYEAAKAEIEKKFPTASAAATPSPATSAPIATAPAVTASVTFEQVVEKLRALHKAQGDSGVAKVLAKFGVSRVPELNGKFANADILAAVELAGV
jgi:hypothetical protein